ncbi:MAG: hypothetical protein H8E62_02600, partial [Planctomycetes bacterium]|nr:hypothetical protein [Planctomycetota bacterium]
EAILNQIEFTGAGLPELQKELSDLQNSGRYYDAMVNERCSNIVFWKLPKEKQVQIMEAGFWQQQPKLVHLMASTLGFRQKDALLTLDYYEDYVNASQLPLYEQGQAFLRIEDKINNLPFFHIYLHEFPIFTKVGKIHSRVMGYLKCAETALAIERYRLKYQSLPESLGVLVPEFMDTAPIDPFDGRTLRYIQPDTGGYTLYTVGEDGVDNGGVSKKQVREKTGESNPKEYDRPFTVRR